VAQAIAVQNVGRVVLAFIFAMVFARSIPSLKKFEKEGRGENFRTIGGQNPPVSPFAKGGSR
jgi:hypothetical protein